jgi:cysteine synthase A
MEGNMVLQKNILECIGHTPLVQLQVGPGAVGQVYAKLEMLNPFGMKDRVARHVLLEAKRQGALRDGAPIIESSSGTMALGLALVGTYLGHQVHIVTDPRIDPITLAKLKTTGCVVHAVEHMACNGWQGARLERLHALLEQYPNAFWPRQYENPENPQAYRDLAQELLEDLDTIDILVAAVGSGGSLCGTARALLSHHPHLRVVAVDAVGSVIFGQPDHPHRLQGGLGNSLRPANVDCSVIDEVHWLSDQEAFAATVELAAIEKIFAGNSSGSVYAVARWLSRTVSRDTTIVAIFPDRGDRYAHTLYNEAYQREKEIADIPLPDRPKEIVDIMPVATWSYYQLKRTKNVKRRMVGASVSVDASSSL